MDSRTQGMNDCTHWSPCALKHVLPAMAQDWIANGHHEPIESALLQDMAWS